VEQLPKEKMVSNSYGSILDATLVKSTPATPSGAESPEDRVPGAASLFPGKRVAGWPEGLLARLESVLDRLERFSAPQSQEYLSIDQAAAVLGVEGKHIRRAVKAGQLTSSNISNGSRKPLYRIARRDLDEWVRSRLVNFAPPQSEREQLVQKYLGPGRRRRNCRSSS
jgi:excisionase family DNA binding protein